MYYNDNTIFQEQYMMMPANLIQVAYGAATWCLDDKKRFPNFLRTSPSQTRGSTNIVQLLSNLTYSSKAKINSVVLIHTDSSYGSDGAQVSGSGSAAYVFELNALPPLLTNSL